jgi:hypothetical protein
LEIHFDISNGALFILLFIVLSISASYAVYFYRNKANVFDKPQRTSLSIIKFLYSFFILTLLLSPLIERYISRSEKPILILGIDNSESVINNEANAEKIIDLIESSNAELDNIFSVETLHFGERVIKSHTPDFTFKKSNYSALFSEIEKRFFNMNVGAVVLVGDGIYNEGRNPEQSIDKVEAPIFTVGVGDTLSKIDQAIIDVSHNPNVFLGNSFPIEIEMMFNRFPYSSTQLSVFFDGELVKSETLNIPQANFYQRKLYNINADEAGLKNVSVVLSPISQEENTENNRKKFIIEVHDNRKNILILSQGPHPDIGAITTTLTNQANFNIRSEDITIFNGDINQFDLIVLNQLPSAMTRNNEIFDTIKKGKTPLLLIVGPRISIPELNNLGLDFSIETSVLNEESFPVFSENFALFNIPENIAEIEKSYPPLATFKTEYEYDAAFSVLAYQKIRDIEMNYPLIMAGDIENRKIGIIFGEGIWRWRLREYLNYENQDSFNKIFVSLFDYLSVQEEREQLRVSYDRIVSEYSQIHIKAQVFNEIFEPINNAEVHFILTDSTGNELRYMFDQITTAYNLNLGFLPAGDYTFEASTDILNTAYTSKGAFSVQELSIEQQNLRANFNSLNYMADNTGGKFFFIDESSELIETLKSIDSIKPKIHKEKIINELIDWKWFLLFIFGLTALEWFLRKFWGSY